MATSNNVQFSIGSASSLQDLFSFDPTDVRLGDGISHCINQTLIRDGYVGAWAQVRPDKDGVYHVGIASPSQDHDLTPYTTLLPAFLQAVAAARTVFDDHQAELDQLATKAGTTASFLPPFGMATALVESVQLLHYPPTETLTYFDYLYSPTNRRWENLLGYNGCPGERMMSLERVVDAVPVATSGGAGGATVVQAVDGAFPDYVKQMLAVFLRATPSGKSTQPIVAYGTPVHNLLRDHFGQQNTGVLSLCELQIVPGTITPVLCANHPAEFLMYDPQQDKLDDFKEILLQDLIAAGWQTTMSAAPDKDAAQVLEEVTKQWTGKSALREHIFEQQLAEFVD